ncbi:hypothetical protein ACFQDE_17365 [Deinococcus caeni]|uniref:hypothetical protein n=1 Tax=Deinococcus caeni TaxID=569127 RepID=UPI003611D772
MTHKILTATLALTLNSLAAAQGTNVRFTLDWAFEGPARRTCWRPTGGTSRSRA